MNKPQAINDPSLSLWLVFFFVYLFIYFSRDMLFPIFLVAVQLACQRQTKNVHITVAKLKVGIETHV